MRPTGLLEVVVLRGLGPGLHLQSLSASWHCSSSLSTATTRGTTFKTLTIRPTRSPNSPKIPPILSTRMPKAPTRPSRLPRPSSSKTSTAPMPTPSTTTTSPRIPTSLTLLNSSEDFDYLITSIIDTQPTNTTTIIIHSLNISSVMMGILILALPGRIN